MWDLHFVEVHHDVRWKELRRQMGNDFRIPRPKARYRTLYALGGWFTAIGQLLETRYKAQATCCQVPA